MTKVLANKSSARIKGGKMMADMGWTSYIENEEYKAVVSCRNTALRNGHTMEEADNCDNGDVGCPDCPFESNDRIVEEQPK